MKCKYCSKEIRNEATFCSECGRKQTAESNRQSTANFLMIYAIKNRKKLLVCLIAIVAIIIGVNVIHPGNKKSAIEGSWKRNDDYTISFNANGKFVKGESTSGTYEIYDNNELVMKYQGFDYIDRDTWRYEWSKENKEKENYWYIEGKTLYLGGEKYQKK